jgi:hypothetical protein
MKEKLIAVRKKLGKERMEIVQGWRWVEDDGTLTPVFASAA